MAVTQNTAIAAGTLNDLLTKLKAEFSRRSNPYSKEKLNNYFGSTAVSDASGTQINATEANKVLNALRMLS